MIFKRIGILCIVVLNIFVATGCCVSVKKNNDSQNLELPIYDFNNKKIGSINCYNYLMLIDNNILYTKLPKGKEATDSLNEMEYWLYDIESQNNYQLLTINEWVGNETFEAIEKDSHFYLGVSTGEYANLENSKLTIYDIDVSSRTMSPILIINGAVPYNSYTIVDNKLILSELLYNGDTDLVEYDLSIHRSEPLIHEYDENDCFVHDSIRHLYSDAKYLYALRVDWDDDERYSLFLDKYSFDYDLIDTIDITQTCILKEFELNDAEIQNECRQFVSYFFVKDDFFYYENFSITSFIGYLKSGNLYRLFDTYDFSYVLCPTQNSNKTMFIQRNGYDSDDEKKRNVFFLVDSKTYEVKIANFFADDKNYGFKNASMNKDGMILLTMGYSPLSEGKRLPDRLYYISIDDLNFDPQ